MNISDRTFCIAGIAFGIFMFGIIGWIFSLSADAFTGFGLGIATTFNCTAIYKCVKGLYGLGD